ncbi:Dolichyl-phosphate-mannose-protein mannosyltransferase [Amycolatopsis arida]|uniref:Dolichyl-phosphate-mannose-protein mannosyltransferase n=1 Tax=Amycolatopsis arida TaxID=587909 RepID=A0A1I5VCB2_9PSEU|nr:glycosyltransferase family 39 protein [Amycolatopsis arida]TDX91228.1 dolichyl-phosphate-mannose-protein mannosyltransferase [Amycolatopsis arida]SFQ05153.1 Dolichyl-phosphate-mannose-protein mannosyltransferase [Amycolatopsis arida]
MGSPAREDTTAVDGATREGAAEGPERSDHHPPAPVAWWPVGGIAAAVGVVLLATAGRIGYFGDELYFLAAGRYHLEWGYADQPWLLPLLARAMDTLFPGSVVGLRLPALLVTVAGVVVTALIARELGGGRHAQTLAAGAYAICPQLLVSGHLLATSTIDPFLWTVTTWLVVRWVRVRGQRGADRLLLLAGCVTAVAMQGKFLIVFLWLALAAVVLVTGPRELLRRPALWAGGAIAVLATVPTLLWQARNGWPYLEMQEVVAEQVHRILGGPLLFVPIALVAAGPLVGAFLAVHGLWQLLRAPELAAYRFLGWTALAVTALFVVTVGRYYYVAGLYGLLFAASAVRLERHRPARWWRWVPTWPVYALSAVVVIGVGLPVRPVSTVTTTDFVASGSLGWPELADTVAAAHRALPPGERDRAVVFTETYWQAGALEVYGPERGLPPVFSPERGYWFTGRPPEGSDPLLVVGMDPGYLRGFCAGVREVERVRLAAVPEENVNQGVPVWLCSGPRAPWDRLWPELRRM